MTDPTPRADIFGQTNDPQRQYEFTRLENDLIEDLAVKMRTVGVILLAVGVVNVVAAFVLAYRSGWSAFRAGPVVMGVLAFLIGLWTRRSALQFAVIPSTGGRDITHLMQALSDLRRLYTLQFYVAIGSVLLLLGLVIYNVLVQTVAGGGPVFSY